MSMMPTPCLPPSSLSFQTRSTEFIFTPSSATGTPFSKLMETYSASSGASSGVTPISILPAYFGSLAGSSSSRPSCERCQRFLSLE